MREQALVYELTDDVVEAQLESVERGSQLRLVRLIEDNQQATPPSEYKQRNFAVQRDPHYEAFMNFAAQFELLKPEDEVRLGRHIRAGIVAESRLEQLGLEVTSEQFKINKLLIDRKQRAFDEFFNKNLRLVASIANGYLAGHAIGKNYGQMDLIQEGCTGLMHAIELFDPEKGFKFSTYATNWIRHKIQRALETTGTTIYVPSNHHPIAKQVRQLLGSRTSDAQIQDKLGIDSEQLRDVKAMIDAMHRVVSYDKPVENGTGASETPLSYYIRDERSETPFEAILEDEVDPDKPIMETALEPALRETLQKIFNDKAIEILSSVMHGETLSATQKRYKARVWKLFSHPAVQAEMRKFDPSPSELEWGKDAACIGHAEIFTQGSAKIEQPGGTFKQVSTKKLAANICANCPTVTRQHCERYFSTEKPEVGRWAGGQISTKTNKNTQK